MPEPVYTFDRQAMRRISAAVQKSEGVKDRKGNKWYPIKGGGGGGGGTSHPIMIGKTDTEFPKRSVLIIQPLDAATESPVGDPVSVYNLFATVAANKWIAFSTMSDGQAILISAECD